LLFHLSSSVHNLGSLTYKLPSIAADAAPQQIPRLGHLKEMLTPEDVEPAAKKVLLGLGSMLAR
jgi:hypothetical protein